MDHPTFGLGIVNTVRNDKIDVAFKAYEKTLVHGKGEPSAQGSPQPTSRQPAAQTSSPTPSAPEAPPAREPAPAPSADGAPQG